MATEINTQPNRQNIFKRFKSKSSSYLSSIPLSIRSKLLLSFFAILIMMASINIVLVVRAMTYKSQYDILINNITTANEITGNFRSDLDTALWDIVKGEVNFEDGNQYQIIDEVNHKIEEMGANADSDEEEKKLEVIRRTMTTLIHYVDELGLHMSQGSNYDSNVVELDNIRIITSLLEDMFQEYVLYEVDLTGVKVNETQETFMQWVITSVAVLFIVILFSIFTAWMISESIYVPIKKLHDVTHKITHEDLAVLVSSSNVDEITELGMSFNIMISKIRELVDETVHKQDELKKAEMRALQAQINPHFLYNTLDTIIWLSEANKKDTAVDVVRSLSSFFRVSLSKGCDWVLINKELEHVSSYLAIQKVRYRDILEYRTEIDDSILDGIILKLTLQPLVENALYHGIKNKRTGGTIIVRGIREDEETIRFEVEDNGIGIPKERLLQIATAMQSGNYTDEIGENGYGIFNVDKRVKLFYGEQYGVTIDSEFNQGTLVKVHLPYRLADTIEKY
ncbi:MAG: sensor histidine kinase [Anaerolineaceae bacterium]|nr:sensor histidine kinase [Anaerolineaceae bacterium]